ncbi:hypothetical protein SteCoe_33841 [Stentor coeruleus]|uniref:PPIase cyclophilin-type domain-containing protein n=1 Tax=Stentor coeruleus TaxID=5963 RepID=A0A1R2AVW1_9CILI|nr:hypothetical protein SteCoe_33841 [Stentor coeruleus]
MKGNEKNELTEVQIYALGSSPYWYMIKKKAKSSNLDIIFHLYFERDWEDIQKNQLGIQSSSIFMISYVNNCQYINLDYFTSIFTIEEPCLDPFTYKHKFSKYLGKNKKYVEWTVKFDNDCEKVVLELDFSLCPRTCENFWQICTCHQTLTYIDTRFHRLKAGLFVEGGVINSRMRSIYTDYFHDENYSYKHNEAGILGMSKEENGLNGTKFYITLRPISYLNNRFVSFGRVVQGMNAIYRISSASSSNETITDFITIVDSKDYFGKPFEAPLSRPATRQAEEILSKTGNFRDLANELLKHI